MRIGRIGMCARGDIGERNLCEAGARDMCTA